MRKLGWLIMLLLLSSLLSAASWQLWQWWQQQSAPQSSALAFTDARQHKTFIVDGETWLGYRLPAAAQEVRIISHANLNLQMLSDPQQESNYRLDYRLETADDKRLLYQQYHHRSKRLLYLERETGSLTPRYFYAELPLAPMAGQRIQIDLGDYPQARTLWLRAGDLPQSITDIAVRVYIRSLDQQQLTRIDWQRFSKQKQQRLADVSIYDDAFLEKDELMELMAGQFKPLGPAGSSYTERTLYARDLAQLLPLEPEQETGSVADANADQYRIRLPRAGRYRLQIEAQQPQQWQLSWLDPYGQQSQPSPLQPLSQTSAGIWQLEQPLEQGWLALSSAEARLNPQLWLLTDQGDQPLATEPAQLRAYRLDPATAEVGATRLSWNIDHIDARATPLRLDFRYTIAATSQNREPPQVHFRLLDQQSRSLRTGRLRIAGMRSDLDRIKEDPNLALSEAVQRYLLLDPAVKRIELSSDQPVWVSAFTQLPDLILEQHLPAPLQPPHSAWFMLRPDQWRQALAAGESSLLQLHPQLTETDTDLLAGRYRWQAFTAGPRARGRQLLVPYNANERVFREESLAVLYSPIPTNRTINRTLLAPLNESEITPSLIYLRDSADPFSWRWHSATDSSLPQWSAGHSGSLALPTLAAGPQQLRLETQTKGRWLMNYLQPGADSYLKLFAYQLGAKKSLRFQIDKIDRQPLKINLAFYSENLHGEQSVLRVRLQARPPLRQPLADWSYLDRRYVISPEAGGSVLIPNTAGIQLAAPQSTTLMLGAELAAGRYQLSIEQEQGAAGYLLLFQLHPGDYAQRQLHKSSVSEQSPRASLETDSDTYQGSDHGN